MPWQRHPVALITELVKMLNNPRKIPQAMHLTMVAQAKAVAVLLAAAHIKVVVKLPSKLIIKAALQAVVNINITPPVCQQAEWVVY